MWYSARPLHFLNLRLRVADLSFPGALAITADCCSRSASLRTRNHGGRRWRTGQNHDFGSFHRRTQVEHLDDSTLAPGRSHRHPPSHSGPENPLDLTPFDCVHHGLVLDFEQLMQQEVTLASPALHVVHPRRLAEQLY